MKSTIICLVLLLISTSAYCREEHEFKNGMRIQLGGSWDSENPFRDTNARGAFEAEISLDDLSIRQTYSSLLIDENHEYERWLEFMANLGIAHDNPFKINVNFTNQNSSRDLLYVVQLDNLYSGGRIVDLDITGNGLELRYLADELGNFYRAAGNEIVHSVEKKSGLFILFKFSAHNEAEESRIKSTLSGWVGALTGLEFLNEIRRNNHHLSYEINTLSYGFSSSNLPFLNNIESNDFDFSVIPSRIGELLGRDNWKAARITRFWTTPVRTLFPNIDNPEPRPGIERNFELGDSGEIYKMVWIPSGGYMMGDESGEDVNSLPRHHVMFRRGFWLGKYEVTVKQWYGVKGGETNRPDDNPIDMVTFNEVKGFISEIGDPFRLPSEAEWEYACRSGNNDTRNHFGDNIKDVHEYGWCDENRHKGYSVVGMKLPNDWGLHDMLGSVTEFCEDKHHPNYNEAPSDGSAWILGGTNKRVLRGGSQGNHDWWLKASKREFANPNQRHTWGFRLVREIN